MLDIWEWMWLQSDMPDNHNKVPLFNQVLLPTWRKTIKNHRGRPFFFCIQEPCLLLDLYTFS